VLRSEWTKLWSLRSTRWSLAAAFAAMGLGILVAAVDMSRWSSMSSHDRLHYNSIDTSLAGYHLAQLAIGVLGVLVISGEYTTGMIRSSFVAVPRRLPVLWAKAAVFASVTFALMLPAALIAFYAAGAVMQAHHVTPTLSSPHALRAVLGVALFMAVLAVFTVSLGALIRNTAGGIATFAGILFVLPGIVAILSSSVRSAINPYLPSSAAAALFTAQPDPSDHLLAPWSGFAVFCGYTALALGAAAFLLRRRDA
jgi:ABC-type transport system involved in multi-copper enzyme maturation permease subunit